MRDKVSDIMTREVVTSLAEDEMAQVARKMASQRISCVVVVSGRKPVGIVSERDIVRVVAERPGMMVGMRVREMMSSPVVTLRPDSTLAEAKRLMLERKFRRFPIVNEEGHLIGLITQTDLLRH